MEDGVLGKGFTVIDKVAKTVRLSFASIIL